MLQLSQVFINKPVLSIRTGGEVATALNPIINPNNLKIEGWHCQDAHSKTPLILQSQEVREIIGRGIVVNDHDSLAQPDELVRMNDLINLNFDLLGKAVVGVSKHRLGKVSDYAVDMNSLYIQKLYVSQSLLKSFTGGALIIDRSQIVEITSRKIVVQDPLQGVRSEAPAAAPAG